MALKNYIDASTDKVMQVRQQMESTLAFLEKSKGWTKIPEGKNIDKQIEIGVNQRI